MIYDVEPRGNRRSSDLMPTQPGRAAIALPAPTGAEEQRAPLALPASN